MMRSAFYRYVLPVAAAVGLMAFIGVPFIDHVLGDWFQTDVRLRARLTMSSVGEPLAALLDPADPARAQAYLERVAGDERLLGFVVCRPDGATVVRTVHVPASVTCPDGSSLEPHSESQPAPRADRLAVAGFDLATASGRHFRVLVVHDLSYIDRRQAAARNFVLAFAMFVACVLAIVVAIGIRALLQKWIRC